MHKSTCIVYENNIPLHIFDNLATALECMCHLCSRLMRVDKNINISMVHISSFQNSSICTTTTKYVYDKTKQMIIETMNNGKVYTQQGISNISIKQTKVKQENKNIQDVQVKQDDKNTQDIQVKQENKNIQDVQVKQENKNIQDVQVKQENKNIQDVQEIQVKILKPNNDKYNEQISILKSDKNTYTMLNNKISNKQLQTHNISILFKTKFYVIKFMIINNLIVLNNDDNVDKEQNIYSLLQNIVELTDDEQTEFLDKIDDEYNINICIKFFDYIESLDEKLISNKKIHNEFSSAFTE
jgi:hypothetical protein